MAVMKNTRNHFGSVVPVVAVLLAVGASSPLAQQEVLVSANVAEVGKGYRTSELRGRAVWNDRNERIGTIPEVVIGRNDIPFAVLEVGSFLDLLDVHLVAVPFKALNIDDVSHKIVLPGATRRALKNFPEFRFHR